MSLIIVLLQFFVLQNIPEQRNILPLDDFKIHEEVIKPTPNLKELSNWFSCQLLKEEGDFVLYTHVVDMESDYGNHTGMCRLNLTKGLEWPITRGNGNGPLEMNPSFNFNVDDSALKLFLYESNTKKMIVYDLKTNNYKEYKLKNPPANGAYAIHNALYLLGCFEGIYSDSFMYLYDENGVIKKRYKGYEGIEENTNVMKFIGQVHQRIPQTTVLTYFPIYIKDDGETQEVVCFNKFDIADPIESFKKKYKSTDGFLHNVYDDIHQQIAFINQNYIGLNVHNKMTKKSYIDIYDRDFNYLGSFDAIDCVMKMAGYIKENKKYKDRYEINYTNRTSRSQYAYYISKQNEEIVYVDFLELFKANYHPTN